MASCGLSCIHSVGIILAVVLYSVSSSISLSHVQDDHNLVGDPTFFILDAPHARERRAEPNETEATNGTLGIPFNITGITTDTPSMGDTDSVSAAAPATVAAAAASAGATTTDTDVPGGMVVNVPGDDGDGDIHWAAHNETIEDDHDYYKVKYIPPGPYAMRYWVDIDAIFSKQPSGFIEAFSVRTTSRRAKRVVLSFPFAFYGQDLNVLLVTTGGFLYVGSYIHRFLASTQYIAPLMANFDPSVTENASIRYFDNGTAFTAEWKNIALADDIQGGEFNFQTTIFKDGRIIFAYKEVPKQVATINTADHPVRIGVADAYYKDAYISPFLKKRSIYEYHKVAVNFLNIRSMGAVVVTPNPTCHDFEDCHSCTASTISFDCSWCHKQLRCSNGFDRFRGSWMIDGCNANNITNEADCNRPPIFNPATTYAATELPKITTKPITDSNIVCAVDTCHHNGACLDSSGTPVCQCVQPWTGTRCEVHSINTCAVDTCHHNGDCLDSPGTPVCQCVQPWTGTRCEVWKEEEDEELEYFPNVVPSSKPQMKTAGGPRVSYGAIAFILVILVLIAVILGWVVYAYKKPTTNSGMFLVEVKNKLRRKSMRASNIKYKYHKPDNDDQLVDNV